MLLCAITDRQRLWPAGSTAIEREAGRLRQMRAWLRDWIEGGVDFIQLREKDLRLKALLALASALLRGIARRQAKILVNLPAASLLTSEDELAVLLPLFDGVHLPGNPTAEDVQRIRQAFRRHGRECLVSMSCHSVEEVLRARRARADTVFYAPVFEKNYAPGGERYLPDGLSRSPGQGLGTLRHACAAAEGMPVFALGGVTVDNAPDCVSAGAAGVAGIRLFQEGDWRRLRPASARRNHI